MRECACEAGKDILNDGIALKWCPRHSEANVQTLEEGLRKYGQHLRECRHNTMWASSSSDTSPPGCTCGLTTLLSTGGET